MATRRAPKRPLKFLRPEPNDMPPVIEVTRRMLLEWAPEARKQILREPKIELPAWVLSLFGATRIAA